MGIGFLFSNLLSGPGARNQAPALNKEGRVGCWWAGVLALVGIVKGGWFKGASSVKSTAVMSLQDHGLFLDISRRWGRWWLLVGGGGVLALAIMVMAVQSDSALTKLHCATLPPVVSLSVWQTCKWLTFLECTKQETLKPHLP